MNNNNFGYKNPLFILAFDHRSTFAQHMFNTKISAMSLSQVDLVREYKKIIFESFNKATQTVVPLAYGAILVDEQFGDEILRQAKSKGITTILTVEKSGQTEFDFEYGQDFADHIEKYKPTFVKVLIKYNPEDENDLKIRQQAKLKVLSDYCHAHDHKFLLEALVIPTPSQLAEFENNQDSYDLSLRPTLTVKMIAQFQSMGIEPDIWKLEGLDKEDDYKMVVNQIKSNNRNGVGLVILGRGASEEKVEDWIRIGAKIEGVVGFAVGRTIFWDSIVAYKNSEKTRDETIEAIAGNFERFYSVFKNAQQI